MIMRFYHSISPGHVYEIARSNTTLGVEVSRTAAVSDTVSTNSVVTGKSPSSIAEDNVIEEGSEEENDSDTSSVVDEGSDQDSVGSHEIQHYERYGSDSDSELYEL
jgi:hypothetical protein